MIQVAIAKKRQANSVVADSVDITITGHAMVAPYGQDIVCAAVSVLYEQLKLFLPNPLVTDDGKVVKMHVIVFASGDKRAIQTFQTMIAQLSKQYPDNVRLKLVSVDGRQG